jgi:hypothetical protein
LFAKIVQTVMLLAAVLVGYNRAAGAETELKTGGFHEVARFRLGGDGGFREGDEAARAPYLAGKYSRAAKRDRTSDSFRSAAA